MKEFLSFFIPLDKLCYVTAGWYCIWISQDLWQQTSSPVVQSRGNVGKTFLRWNVCCISNWCLWASHFRKSRLQTSNKAWLPLCLRAPENLHLKTTSYFKKAQLASAGLPSSARGADTKKIQLFFKVPSHIVSPQGPNLMWANLKITGTQGFLKNMTTSKYRGYILQVVISHQFSVWSTNNMCLGQSYRDTCHFTNLCHCCLQAMNVNFKIHFIINCTIIM